MVVAAPPPKAPLPPSKDTSEWDAMVPFSGLEQHQPPSRLPSTLSTGISALTLKGSGDIAALVTRCCIAAQLKGLKLPLKELGAGSGSGSGSGGEGAATTTLAIRINALRFTRTFLTSQRVRDVFGWACELLAENGGCDSGFSWDLVSGFPPKSIACLSGATIEGAGLLSASLIVKAVPGAK